MSGNIHDCMQRALDAGQTGSVRAAAAISEYDQLVAGFVGYMPRPQAEQAAARALKEASSARAVSRRHTVIAQVQSTVRIKALMDQVSDPATALKLLLEYDPRAAGIGFDGESVRSLQDGLIKSVNASMSDVLKATGRNLLGSNRDPALMRNLVRELHGEATKDATAKQLADGVKAAQERLRKLFNAHGGNIGKLDNFGVSHSHNVAKIRNAGFDEWSSFIQDKIDWARITNKKTGQPFSAAGTTPPFADVEVFLQDVWNGITSRGWDSRDPSMAVGGKALYNTRAEHRVLHFKNGSDWMDYNKTFGTSDPFTAMVGGMHGIARDIAQMRVLGPNPRLGLELATQHAQKRANMLRDAKLESRVNRSAALSRTMLSHLDGSVNVPVNEFWASFFGGVRKVLTGTQLGSALLSSTTDAATISMAAKVAGMNPTNVVARSAKLMSSPEARRMAARGGYIADSLADMGATAARYTGDTYAPEIAERISGFTMRASGLAFWTDMNKMAFQMEFGGMLAENADKAFGDLPEQLQGLFNQRKITASDWDKLRDPASMFAPDPDTTFISPMHWLEHTTTPRAEAEGLAMRLQMLIEEQLEFAVPTASVEGRALMVGDTKPGTFSGELLRSSTMYKGFALSLTLGQIRRHNSIPTTLGRAKYAAQMSAGLLVLGGVAVQLKEMAKGRDPRPINEGKFWMAAAFQGGGLGIFGDFFASETSRSGGGIAETLAGPVAGFASDVIKPIASNVTRVVEGKDTTFGRDASNLLRYNTPVASSLWYQRLAFDRLVADQVQSLLDPDAEAVWRRQEKKRERDFGTETWWGRGETLPERGPDLSNALGAK